jgi:hypothetical protein
MGPVLLPLLEAPVAVEPTFWSAVCDGQCFFMNFQEILQIMPSCAICFILRNE